MTATRPKRSDLYGYRHSDDDSSSVLSNKANSHAPPMGERLAELFEEAKVNDPPAQSRMEHGGDPPTKGMGTRLLPYVHQQQHHRMNEHYGQIDPESDREFFRNKMNGTTKRGAGAAQTKRPINMDDATHTQVVQQWGNQVQGAQTSSMHQGGVQFGSSTTHQIDTTNPPRPRSILRNKNPPETTASQVSRASSASFFGNARSKLRGYLSTFKHKKHPTGIQNETQSEAGGGGYIISSTKNPRYRQNPHGNNSKGVAQSVTSGDGISYTSTIQTKHYDAASLSSKHSKNSKNSKSKKAKNRLSRKLDKDNSNKGIQIQVFDLPWSDARPNSDLRGRYSGPVNDSLLPHGKGTVMILREGELLKCCGTFEDGQLASNLVCKSEDEVFDADENDETRNRLSTPPPPTSAANTRIRPGRDPSGVLSDEVPLNHPYTRPHAHHHHNQHHNRKAEKPKRQVKAPTIEKKPSTETDKFNSDIEQFLTSRKKPPARVDDTPISDDLQHKPTRIKYNLGDIARTPRDMVIHKSDVEAIHSASLLKKYEQAFLKRSNGLWTAAVLADRSLQPIKTKRHQAAHWHSEWEIDPANMELEDCMLFVINGDGATKIVQRRHWGRFIRRMVVHETEKVIEEETSAIDSAAGTDEA